MIKTFEHYVNSSEKDIFIKRLKNVFTTDDVYKVRAYEKIIDINNDYGLLYLDFYNDDEIIDNFFEEIKNLNEWLLNNKENRIHQEIKKLYDILNNFIDKYYSKEYYDYKKTTQIKKFKI